MKTVTIIGGGFSGTMAAVNLARLSDEALKIVLVNDRHPLGRGIAYSTTRSEHLLNVAARNMSAVPDHPGHFLDWLHTRSDFSDLPEPQLREMYVPRRVYGDYLRSLLQNYLAPIDSHHPAEIEIIEAEAVDIVPSSKDGSADVVLNNGDKIASDRILLATGNQPPARLGREETEEFKHPQYCPDPWGNWRKRIPNSSENIVIVGTGLSMVDSFLTLEELGWRGQLIAISRNGMIPQSHFRGIDYPDFLPENPESVGLAGMYALLKTHCEQLTRLGENPGLVVDRLRPFTQRIWQKFSLEEKQQFLKHYAARWNVIRHRIAQPIHQRLTEAITEGRVKVQRGSLEEIRANGGSLEVVTKTPDGDQQIIPGGLVINCTGPNAGFSYTKVKLFQNLLQRGLIIPDELDMGIQVGPDFTVIDANGVSSSKLYAMGALMKGTLWETIAVPELRGQAMRVAEMMIATSTDHDQDRDYRLSVEEEHVIEYYI